MSAFEPRRVEPLGQRETEAFVSRSNGTCGLERMMLNVYPSEPRGERLREARTGISKDAPWSSLSFDGKGLLVDGRHRLPGERTSVEREDRRYLSLREAATLAGLSAVEFSGLEFGRSTLDDEAWERLIALVDGARLAKGTEGPGGPSGKGEGR